MVDGLLYNPHYCIASVGANCILLIMFFMKRNYSLRSNKIFFVMLIDNLLASLINITTFYTISFPERHPQWINYASNIAYLLVYNFMAVLFLLYVDSKTKIGSIKKVMSMIGTTIIIYDAFVILTTPFTKWIIYYNEANVYSHGPLMYSLYITAFICVAIAITIFIAKRKMFNHYQVLSILLFAIGVVFAIIFQFLHRSQVISNFVCTMILFFIHTAFENQAYYLYADTLCYNRRAFIKTIDSYRFRKEDYLLAIIRIDDFENIKHSLGRMGVDDLAERIAERICREFGKSAYYVDINCFAVIKLSANTHQLSRQIKECFTGSFNLEIGDDEIELNLEPVISFINVHGENVEGYEMTTLIQSSADHFRDTEHMIQESDELIKPIRREKEVLRLIDNAIKNDGFMVYYQPILDIHSRTFNCSEALIRLKDEKMGFVGPEEFIPIAEKNGRIHDIGDYVFRTVCRFIKVNDVLSKGVKYIEINLSPEQCNRMELANQLISVATEFGVDFRQINLEITETAEMKGYGMVSVNDLITNLHSRGVTFSLDDFGSGFAAIDYLIKLPVDIVKIDKGILWQAMNDEASMTILKNTIRMIKEVGKKIVVEGIETKEMADILIANGCDYLQGYLFSRPLPPEAYIEFISGKWEEVMISY